MADITIHVLKPSVNNLTARIFVRAAGLDFEEVDAWGVTTSPEFMKMNPAHLTPTIEEAGLPKGALWESCAIMQYLCNKHGLTRFYPADPADRAMIDSAMCYLLATVYPLLARATYPALNFPQYPGEVGSSDAEPEAKAEAQRAAEAALAEPLEVYRTFFMDGKRSSAAPSRRSPTCAWPRRSSSCERSTTTSPSGSRPTCRRWRRPWATPTPSRPATCAATSPTSKSQVA